MNQVGTKGEPRVNRTRWGLVGNHGGNQVCAKLEPGGDQVGTTTWEPGENHREKRVETPWFPLGPHPTKFPPGNHMGISKNTQN